MAGKKNKNPVGAPRTVSFPPKDMIALGEEMIQWLNKHPQTLHLSEWYTIEKMFTYNQWKTMIVIPEFFPYYEKALKLVGKQYLDKNSNVRDGISQRWQRVYFKDLKEEEDETKRFEIEVKAEADIKNQIPPHLSTINSDHENMLLKDEVRELKQMLKKFEDNANQSKAG